MAGGLLGTGAWDLGVGVVYFFVVLLGGVQHLLVKNINKGELMVTDTNTGAAIDNKRECDGMDVVYSWMIMYNGMGDINLTILRVGEKVTVFVINFF